jgi:hypothetical protein
MTQWHIRAIWALALGLGALVAPVHAQEASIKRATELRESPGDKAASLGALPEQSAVVRTGERQGSWVKVRTSQGKSGWVHMFDLGAQPASASGSSSAASGLRGLGGLFGGGSTTTATATVGIRGLSAEDIANAQPNPAAVGQAEKMRLDAEQARQFAGAAALRQRSVEPLPEPPRPASGGTAPSPDSNFVN